MPLKTSPGLSPRQPSRNEEEFVPSTEQPMPSSSTLGPNPSSLSPEQCSCSCSLSKTSAAPCPGARQLLPEQSNCNKSIRGRKKAQGSRAASPPREVLWRNKQTHQEHALKRLRFWQKALPCGADLLTGGGGEQISPLSSARTLNISLAASSRSQ